MYCEPFTAVNGNPAMGSSSIPSHSGDPPNLVDSNDKRIPLEYDDGQEESSFGDIGMFGDFCLMCGEMMNGERFHGGVYCSEECEYHQSLTSESDWCDLSLEGYQLPSYGGSTAVSSAKTSPLNSPNLQASGRLAILCSGPPPCELLLPLDLGERLLGAKAVAERYLEKQPESWQDDGEAGDEKQDDDDAANEDEETVRLDWKSIHSTVTPSPRAGVSRGPYLKSRPALAQLTDLRGHLTDSDFGKQQPMMSSQPGSPQSLSLIELPLLSSSAISTKPRTGSHSRRRVSDPAQQPSQSISSPRQLYHSSFSLTSLSSLSPSSRDCESYFH